MPITDDWIGGAGDWDIPTNWSANAKPGALDGAVFSGAANADLTNLENENIASLQISSSSAAVDIQGQLTVGAAHLNLVTSAIDVSAGSLTVDGGGLIAGQFVTGASGTVHVTNGGTYQWNGSGSTQNVDLGNSINDTFQFSTPFGGTISNFVAGDIISYTGTVNSVVIGHNSVTFNATNGQAYVINLTGATYDATNLIVVGNSVETTVPAHVNPTITAANFSVAPNQSVAISPDLTISNPSGDNLTIYRVIDGGHGTGHLTVGGTVEPDGQWFKASSDWSNVQYVGGSSAGTDSLRVEVFDATTHAWVLSNVFKAATAAHVNPTITAANFSVAPNQSIAISPDLTISNPSGDNLTIYRVIDGGHGTGHLTVGGTVEPDGQWFKASSDWSNVQYVGGSSAGTNSLRVEVFDATTHAWVLSNVFKAATASPSPPPSPVGVQDHQGLEPSASVIGIQDHQGLEHQTMV